MQAVASASKSMEFGRQYQGQTVDGRFLLDQYLGGSDNKAVFLTRISGGATKAAIKLIRANACNPEAQLAVWRAAAKLSHPNLIRIFDGGRCWLAGNDLLFVVTEYAEENLGQVLPQRPLSAEEAESTLPPVLDALTFLHAKNFIHGHLRPSNVMAVREQLKVSSDGIQTPGAPLQKREASIYDAPEASRGQLSPAADVWSLGATLAETLTQRIPRKNDMSLKLQQPFADIVSHALIEDPSARWTVADIQARLSGKKIADQKPTAIPQSTAAPVASAANVARVARARDEKSRLPFIVASVVAVAVIAIAVLLMRSNSTQSAQQSANTHTSAARPAESIPAAANSNTESSSQPTTAASAPGQVINRVLPTPSRSALNTIHGTIKVRVKVRVDASGNVTHAGFVTPGPSQYFARLAMQAAQQWKFVPVSADSEPTLLFEYNRRGVDASVQPARP